MSGFLQGYIIQGLYHRAEVALSVQELVLFFWAIQFSVHFYLYSVNSQHKLSHDTYVI